MRASFVTVIATMLSLATGGLGLVLSGQVLAGQALAAEPSAVGLWQATDNDTGQPKGWFIISAHNGVYVGAIAKMFLQPGQSPTVTCDRCRDDRHGKRWLGLEIIRGMKRDGLNYEDGTILDPRDGDVYNAKMTLTPDGHTLVVRGYLGISLFGQNQYWTRLPDSAYNGIDPSIIHKYAAGTSARMSAHTSSASR